MKKDAHHHPLPLWALPAVMPDGRGHHKGKIRAPIAPVEHRVDGAQAYLDAVLTIPHAVMLPPPAEREVVRPLPYPSVEGGQEGVD